jgi:hypothetical protein
MFRPTQKYFLSSRSRKELLRVSLYKRLKCFFFVTGLETLQIQGVKMSTGGSSESNVRSFEAFLTIYLSIITQNF